MASAEETIVGAVSQWGLIGTTLAVAAVPVVAAIAAYVTRMASEGKIGTLEGELARLKTASTDEATEAERRYAELDEKYQAILRSGALIQTQLQAIMAAAEEIAVRLDAEQCAILVPAPTVIAGDEPDQLLFLCASGEQAAVLKSVHVPINSSIAGQVFRTGQTTITTPPTGGFSNRTDKVADFKTREVLSLALRHRMGRMGVVQFLNKRGGRNFGSEDRDRAETECASLAVRVAEFLAEPRRLIELGHAPRRNRLDATMMFMDLSNSTSLFDSLDSSVVTDLFNQYFQELCTIALHHGATIEQFAGDGAMLTFNVGQRVSDHPNAAFAAALEMRGAFRLLCDRWKTLGYAGTERLFVRIGLSAGMVTRAEVGHAQARKVTVIGPAVNEAALACRCGARDHDTVIVSASFKSRLGTGAVLAPLATKTTAVLFEAV